MAESSDEILQYDLKDLLPWMVAKAHKELKETHEVRKKALVELRDLIKKEKHLVIFQDDHYLTTYLRSRKYDVKKAFEVLQNFWGFVQKYHYMYEDVQMLRMKELLLKNIGGVLNYRDRLGCTVCVFKAENWDTSECSFEELMQVMSLLLNVSVRVPATQVCGYRFIIDLKGFTWSQMRQLSKHAMMIINTSVNCFPARYKGIHFICGNKLFNRFVSVLQPFLTAKLKKRMFFHDSDLEVLKQFIHPSVLPAEYGGEGEPLNNVWTDETEEGTKYYLKLLTLGYQN